MGPNNQQDIPEQPQPNNGTNPGVASQLQQQPSVIVNSDTSPQPQQQPQPNVAVNPIAPSAPSVFIGGEPYQQQPSVSGGETPKKPRFPMKKMKKWPLIVAGVALVGGIAAWSVWHGQSSKPTTTPNSLYMYAQPKLQVSPDTKFTFAYKECSRDVMAEVDSKVQVYIDADLTVPAPDGFVGCKKGVIQVAPNLSWSKVGVTTSISQTYPELGYGFKYPANSGDGTWSESSDYYIVQRSDAEGKALKKPIVTHFSVKQNNAVPQPTPSAVVDKNGSGVVTWQPVKGATAYYIIKIEHENGKPTNSAYVQSTLIGYVDSGSKTSWTTGSQDFGSDSDFMQKFDQNSSMQAYSFSDDDVHSSSAVKVAVQDQNKKTYKIGVFAKTNAGYSRVSLVQGLTPSRLPNTIAYNAVQEMPNVTFNDKIAIANIPTQLPVTMCDGSTAMYSVLLDPKSIKLLPTQPNIAAVPFHISGTKLTGRFYVDSSQYGSGFGTAIVAAAQRNIEAQAKVGSYTPYAYSTTAVDFDKQKSLISSKAPSVSYPITATNDFSRYLAANMIAGNEYIDVSKYVNNKQGISVYDAAYEAAYQNPYVLGIEGVNLYSSNNVLSISYTVSSKDERKKEQQDIASNVDAVISKIIKNGMTDEQKAKAINDYIANNTAYDYDALAALKQDSLQKVPAQYEYAWSPLGTFEHKKAVCGGYAETFKVLADKAGLAAIYVNGDVKNGNSHAWNKVRIDGKWKAIDVTWNDSESNPNRYFLVSDATMDETRTQSNYFVVDQYVGSYAAL